MWGQVGFSYVGMIYLTLLFIPNYLWTKRQPAGYRELAKEENKVLLLFERVGQVCVTCCAFIFRDFNLTPFSWWSLWLVISFMLMLLYEAYWIRYFTRGNTMENFYGSFLGIPVPGASLPVASFLLLGIYGKVIWMIASIIVLGIGHIGIHLQYLKKWKGR